VALPRSLLPALYSLASLISAAGAAAAPPPGNAILLEPVRIELAAGEARNVEIDLGGALEPGFLYKAELPSTEISRDAVTMGFMVPGEPGSSAPLEGERVALARRGSSLGLRVLAGRCCGGTVRRKVELLPPPGSRTAKGPVWPVHLPVEIVVNPDSGACRRDWMSPLRGLVWGLLLVFAVGLKEQSHFLSRKELARRLEALRLDEMGDVRKWKTDLLALVEQELTPWRRTWNWLRSNPLVIGLPGRSYYETVELHLQPGKRFPRSRLILCPERELHRRVEKHPERGEGRLFASAWKGLSLFTVPLRGRVGPFLLDRPGDLPRKILWLRGDERLLRVREEGEDASEWRRQRL